MKDTTTRETKWTAKKWPDKLYGAQTLDVPTIRVDDPHGTKIAEVVLSGYLVNTKDPTLSEPTQKEWRDELVHRYNSHQSLVEALEYAEQILSATESTGAKQLGNGAALQQARTVLAQVREGGK